MKGKQIKTDLGKGSRRKQIKEDLGKGSERKNSTIVVSVIVSKATLTIVKTSFL